MAEREPVNLDELERLAKAAPPGPWVTDGRYPGRVYCDDSLGSQVADTYAPLTPISRTREKSTAQFIAAANPATVLELIRMVRESYSRALRDVREGQELAQAEGLNPDCGFGCRWPDFFNPGCLVHDQTAPVHAGYVGSGL